MNEFLIGDIIITPEELYYLTSELMGEERQGYIITVI